MSERIQKFLATLGIASRREIERMIDEGRIIVNGAAATPGQQIDDSDNVRVDGRPIGMQRKAEPTRALIYKKRTGELVTRDDPEGRRTVFRKLPKLATGRWIAVGRLDINTSGLLLFTNHGELARRLTHPSFEIPRTYAVRILGTVDDAVITRWKAGVDLDDGKARFERVETGGASGLSAEDNEGGANQWFRVTVREGRNRLVRRLIESQKLQVSRLIRVSYGPIELGRGIKSGTARDATPAEMLALLDATGLSEDDAGLSAAAAKRGSKPGSRAPQKSATRRGESPAPRNTAARDGKRPPRAGARGRDDEARPARPSRVSPSSRRGASSPSAPRSASPARPTAGRPAPRKPRPKPTRRG